MASEALAIRPETPADDYRSLCAALEASARGRAFLNEYARRNRNADTGLVLHALDGLAAQMRADAAAITDLHGELRTLLTAIRLARPDIDSGRPPGKVAMLTALVDLLERRIDGIVDSKDDAEMAPDAAAVTARPQLAVVPAPDEPELPIPSPFATQGLAIAVVAAQAKQAAASAAIMPEVNVFDSAQPAPAKAAFKSADTPAARNAGKPSDAKNETPAADRLKALLSITALSEDERLALFS
jgi:chemotaxis protein histidine kinase CheA